MQIIQTSSGEIWTNNPISSGRSYLTAVSNCSCDTQCGCDDYCSWDGSNVNQ